MQPGSVPLALQAGRALAAAGSGRRVTVRVARARPGGGTVTVTWRAVTVSTGAGHRDSVEKRRACWPGPTRQASPAGLCATELCPAELNVATIWMCIHKLFPFFYQNYHLFFVYFLPVFPLKVRIANPIEL